MNELFLHWFCHIIYVKQTGPSKIALSHKPGTTGVFISKGYQKYCKQI